MTTSASHSRERMLNLQEYTTPILADQRKPGSIIAIHAITVTSLHPNGVTFHSPQVQPWEIVAATTFLFSREAAQASSLAIHRQR